MNNTFKYNTIYKMYIGIHDKMVKLNFCPRGTLMFFSSTVVLQNQNKNV